jgi:hypothetical protein
MGHKKSRNPCWKEYNVFVREGKVEATAPNLLLTDLVVCPFPLVHSAAHAFATNRGKVAKGGMQWTK